MKIIILMLVSFIILVGCGKKSQPKYQGKIEVNKIV
jgi:hypothetical protein